MEVKPSSLQSDGGYTSFSIALFYLSGSCDAFLLDPETPPHHHQVISLSQGVKMEAVSCFVFSNKSPGFNLELEGSTGGRR